MKKIYIQPNVLIVNVRTTHMISASVTTSVEGLGYGGNTSDASILEGAAKANNYSVWDDDWNE